MHTWNTDMQRGDLYTGTYSHTVAQTGSCCHTEESFRHKYLHRKQQPDPLRNERLCIQRHANADTRFNLGLSGWEMKEGTNLLRWADLLNGCHNSFPSLWKESACKMRREQSVVQHNDNIKHFYEHSLAAVGDPSVLIIWKELKLLVHFSKLSKGAVLRFSSIAAFTVDLKMQHSCKVSAVTSFQIKHECYERSAINIQMGVVKRKPVWQC